MWLWLILVLMLGLAGLVVVSAMRARVDRHRQYAEAIRLWSQTTASRRPDAMRCLLAHQEANGPAWYLLGCAMLLEGHTKQAARAFGMAHHGDCNLETAALLTFACLKATEGSNSDVVRQIATTWEEMNRPNLFRRHEDRLMLDCLAKSGQGPPALSRLARLAWLVIAPPLRPMPEQLAAGDPPWALLQEAATVERTTGPGADSPSVA